MSWTWPNQEGLELELAFALDSELELLLDAELEVELWVEVDVAAVVAPAAFTAMFAPSPRKVATLNAPATTRDRAAACRRRRDRGAPTRDGWAVGRAWLSESFSITTSLPLSSRTQPAVARWGDPPMNLGVL